MQTKIEFILSAEEARQKVAGYGADDVPVPESTTMALISKLIEELGLDGERGGWVCKATRTATGGVKITGKLVPPGGAVLA